MGREMINKIKASFITGFVAMALLVLGGMPVVAQDDAESNGLAALAFLEGQWRGDNDGLIFEEMWGAPSGGVVTAMARGVRNGELAVLEYIVVSDTDKGPVMRFKHFKADYTNWDGEEEPITLYLGRQQENNVSFVNEDPEAVVQRIRYFITDNGQMQTDISLMREGVMDMFSLTFDRVGSDR